MPPADIKLLDRAYQSYERKQIPIFIDATQDKVKASVYVITKNAPYAEPSQDYVKNIIKHLKFFWGQDGKKSMGLEDFGITIPALAEVEVIKPVKKKKTKAAKVNE